MYPRLPRLASAAFLASLFGACASGERSGCPPTDSTCAPPVQDALVVSSVVPANGARHVDPSTTVVVTFSRPVQPASVTSASLTVGSAEGSLSVSGATVTFTPATPLAPDDDHQVRVQGVRDLAGVGMAAPFTSTFVTGSRAVCTECPSTSFTRDDVEAEGTVVQTADGFTVEGSLSLGLGGSEKITFLDADVDVRFDASGRLRSLSGKVQIPSPHERIAFAEPIRADVGIFTGRFLNEERDIGIMLKDDTDYFVFDLEKTLSMSIATGETGDDATKPVVVRNPTGSRTLMIVDYRDPMYYVYGQRDLIGAAGTGWSLNGRIPFVPAQQVAGLGAFDGRTTRTGTFPFKKIMSVTGQMVDNNATELHLSEEDPFASTLRAGYQAGFNGELTLDLFLKEIVGLEIPIASASGGVRMEAGSQTGVSGFAFARGATSRDFSWWPAFIPVRPATELDVQARVETSGSFQVFLGGQYGWDFPSGTQAMGASFELTDQAMTLEGTIRDGAVDFRVTGVVTAPSTRVFITPPPALLQQLHGTVNDRVLTEIASAQAAWESLQKATADYQFELSLRGVRQLLPGIVDVAKAGLSSGVTAALKDHEGTIYYGLLKGIVDQHTAPYYQKLDALRSAALSSQDNAATRTAIESALRAVAANKIFSMSHTHYVLGVPVVTVSFSRRILTDAQADMLIAAANNVKHIPETSNIMISMRQIYEQIPTRAIFEQVRDDITDGLLVMEDIGELGFSVPHEGMPRFDLYAVIGGQRYDVGSMDALTVAALAAKLTDAMIQALRSN